LLLIVCLFLFPLVLLALVMGLSRLEDGLDELIERDQDRRPGHRR
jgi:hypothetical protein